MLDFYYDSNQGYCLCKQPAPLCAKEQLCYYKPAAENKSTAIGWGDAGWTERLRIQSITRAMGITEMPAVYLSATM